ncbi:hypothetical protein [Amycolatopsis marina]|uniref:hypothetical protein n=1 Tax=Amycolatopsis marina TaxID=490629 RepID=UPI000B81A5EF|nr:hypothetical protein [Amycolatopsis marina]
MTVAELVGRARTVALRRRPDDTMPMPAVSAGDVGARHRRPAASGSPVGEGRSRSRLAVGGGAVAILSMFLVAGGLVLGQGGGEQPPGDISDGAVAPARVGAPTVVTIEGVAHPGENPPVSTPAASQQAEAPEVAERDAAERRSDPDASAPAQDSGGRAGEDLERRFEEWESRINELPGVPDW